MPLVGTRANASAGALGFGAKKGKLPYMWVVVGSSGAMQTSTDLPSSSMTWTDRTSSFGSTAIYNIASSGSRFVAVGASGKLATSDNGIDWTQRTSSFGGTTSIFSVGYGNKEWVAVGTSKLAYSTDNGATWTQFSVASFSPATSVGSAPKYGNGYWVVGGNNGDLIYATSVTGTWTRVASGSGGTTLGTGENVVSEYFSNVSLWVIGSDTNSTTNAIASASTPNTWTARSLPNSAAVNQQFASNSSTIIIATNN